jgi:hypothetical protein
MANSPTRRALELLRGEGYTCDVCERYLHAVKRRRDLYGAFDLVAVREDLPGVLGVQASVASGHASRVAKLRACPALTVWLRAGNRAEVITFGRRGGKWFCRRTAIEAETLEPRDLTPRLRPRRARKGERQLSLFGV